MAGPSWIGKKVRRIEDPKLIRGHGQFADDIRVESTLHLHLIRSPYAHARITSINIDAAKAAPGVVAVLSAADLDVPFLNVKPPKGGRGASHPLLARERVHYVGEAVVAILASSKVAAEDASALVDVQYETLPAVVNPLEAVHDTQLVHEKLGTNVLLRRTLKAGNATDAFNKAHTVVKERIVNQRVIPLPMEVRGTIASWEGTRNTLTVYAGTQAPHDLRDTLATHLNLPSNQVRVITPDIGGGFGVKINAFPEDILVAWLAKRFNQPVKWIEGRQEHMLATAHGRDQIGELEAALDEQGRMLAIRGTIYADLGAYLLDTTAESPTLTLPMLQGPYTIQHLDIELLEVATNKVPTSAYRGAGRPEATFYLERLMDISALATGLDPAEIRKRNFIPKDAFPYKTITTHTYDSGDYTNALELLLEKADYQALRAEQEKARADGRLVGIGLSTYVEVCAFGWDLAKVRLNADGSAVVFTGTSPHGQGTGTGFAMIVAEELGVTPEDVQVVHGDTVAVPSGQGTMGSRTLVVGGSSILQAAHKVREKLLKIAAHKLEAPERDIELINQAFQVKGVPAKAVSVKEIAGMAYTPNKLPEGVEPGLEESATFTLKNATFPFGAHLCMVEVDADTGHVKVIKYVSVDDCGTVMNPLLVEGQVHGGIGQAVGQSLFEGVTYDADGQMLNSTLMDYAIPRASDFPELELYRTVTPSPTNPLGVKGVGEAGTIGGTPAVANAVIDALKPFGVRHLDMPFQAPKVWRAMRNGVT